MIEKKLQAAADRLPEPRGDFLDIQKRENKQSKPVRIRKLLRPVLVTLALVLALAGMTRVYAYSKMRYGMWVPYYSSSFRTAEDYLEEFGLTLPEEMAGLPFSTTSRGYLAPQGKSMVDALLAPAYTLVHLEYKHDGGCSLEHEHTDCLDLFGISIGSTENDMWRYYFSFTDEGEWAPDGLIPESFRTVEYAGHTLQLGTTSHYSSATGKTTYIHSLTWVDESRNICISIHQRNISTPEPLIEYAKLIIDMNP